LRAWNLNTDAFDYSPGGDQFRYFPTGRVDYNVTQNHRFTAQSVQRFESDPDILNSNEPRFPGSSTTAAVVAPLFLSAALRSTFGRTSSTKCVRVRAARRSSPRT